ncbi:MAG: hypothetical protein KatS3mg126_0913 [Lysobacteraceae bacterium]|nr:MAG: hypothetical protein KatS3mg126_0913 [Xanthomonadaceae bacterium]
MSRLGSADAWLQRLRDAAQPVRLFLLAGEQVTPNAEAVALLAQWVPLASVHVACTKDERRSLAPAKRLRQLIQSDAFRTPFGNVKNIKVVLSEPGLDVLPQAVRAWFLAERQRYPHSLWVLNLTGALKSMNYGLLDFVGEEDVLAIYREIVGGWFALLRDSEGVTASPLATLNQHVQLIDRVPLLALVQAQYGSVGEREAVLNLSASELPPVPDAVALTRALCEKGFEWEAAFAAVGLDTSSSGKGHYLERFVCALLAEAGIGNIAWSVVSANEQGVRSMEVDVLFRHRGTLWTVDCKLPDAKAEPAYEQIRVAIDAAERLGGSGARAILLRPSWEPDATRRALAKRSGAVILDREECARLVDALADVLGLAPLPPSLVEIKSLLESYHDCHGNVLLDRRHHPCWLPRSSPEKLPNLLEGIKARIDPTRGNTLVFALGSDVLLAVIKPQDEQTARVPPVVAAGRKRKEVENFEVLVSRNDLLLLRVRPPQGRSPLDLTSALLAGCEGREVSLVALRKWFQTAGHPGDRVGAGNRKARA